MRVSRHLFRNGGFLDRCQAAGQVGAARGEGVGDVLDEDKAEHQVLVLGGVHVGAQLVGGGPEGLLDVFEHVRGRGLGGGRG